MITSIITVEELQEKIYDKIVLSQFSADSSGYSRELIRARIGEFTFSCYYHLSYRYYSGSYDYPSEAVITSAYISELEIDYFDDDNELEVSNIEDYINLKLEEEW